MTSNVVFPTTKPSPGEMRNEEQGLHSIGNWILAVRELFDPSLASLDLNLKMLAGNSFIPRNC